MRVTTNIASTRPGTLTPGLRPASGRRTWEQEKDDIQQALDYMKENPDADFSEAYTAKYDKPYKDSIKNFSGVGVRLNTAIFLGVGATHPIAGKVCGGFFGLAAVALGGLELAEGIKRDDSYLKKAGAFNLAIGATAAAAPFVPGFPWWARLAPLGLVGLREVWLRNHQKNTPTFTLPPEPGRAPKSAASPANSTQIGSLAGPAPALKPANESQRVGRALDNLAAQGWSFQTLRDHEGYLAQVNPKEALDFLTGDRDTALRSGDRLLLLEPGHKDFSENTWHHVVDQEGVAAVDFFHGSGDREVLADPKLAQSLKNLADMGVETSKPHARYRFHRPNVATYMSYQRDHQVSMKLEELPLGPGPLTREQITDLDSLTGLDAAQRRQFLESRLVGASISEAMAQFQETDIDVEMEENTLTIGGFTIEVN